MNIAHSTHSAMMSLTFGILKSRRIYGLRVLFVYVLRFLLSNESLNLCVRRLVGRTGCVVCSGFNGRTPKLITF